MLDRDATAGQIALHVRRIGHAAQLHDDVIEGEGTVLVGPLSKAADR